MPKRPEHLSHSAIKALALIIMTAVGGIIALAMWGLALRYGVVGVGGEVPGGQADEALSILGNIASAAVGGLVGWLTRDLLIVTSENAAAVKEAVDRAVETVDGRLKEDGL